MLHPPLALSRSSLGGPLEDRISATAAAGFGGIELFWHDIERSGLSLTEITARIRDSGPTIFNVQPIRGFEGASRKSSDLPFAAARTVIEAAARLGARQVGVCASERADAGGIAEAAVQLRQLGEVGKSAGITIGFKALSWSTRLHTLMAAAEAVARADHPNVRLIVDTFHLHVAGGTEQDLLLALQTAPVGLVQVANIEPEATGYALNRSRHHRALQGPIPVAEMLGLVLQYSQDTPLSVELFSDRLRAQNPYTVARATFAERSSLAWVWQASTSAIPAA